MQGAPGYQLTWMDAKAGDWVVTPRRGKAVEINALWFNALRLMADWLARTGDPRRRAHSSRRPPSARSDSFNRRFWNEATGYLFDVVDGEHGDDAGVPPEPAVRDLAAEPGARSDSAGAPVLDVVERELVTPVGLRSLSPQHPDFKPTYRGDLLRARRRLSPGHGVELADRPVRRRAAARAAERRRDRRAARARAACSRTSASNCIGSVSEVFDAEPPYHAGRLHRAGVGRRRAAAQPRANDAVALRSPLDITSG